MEYILEAGVLFFAFSTIAMWMYFNGELRQHEYRIRTLERHEDKATRITNVYHHLAPKKGEGIHALLK